MDLGRKHTEESKEKISVSTKKYINTLNENQKEDSRERIKESMKGINISERMKKSEKWNFAILEGRIGRGGNGCKNNEDSEEPLKKISDRVTLYFSKDENIENHRKVMSEKLGESILCYDVSNNLIGEYPSIAETGRVLKINHQTISSALKFNHLCKKQYIFKYKNK